MNGTLMPIELLAVSILVILTIVGMYFFFTAYFHGKQKELENNIKTLEEHNKAFKSVWDIQRIIVSGLGSHDMGEKIVHALHLAFEHYGYMFVTLLEYDAKQNGLCVSASSFNQKIPLPPQLTSFFSKAFCVPLSTNPLLMQVLEKKQMSFIEHFEQIVGAKDVPPNVPFQTTVAFPLQTLQGASQAILLFGVGKRSQDIPVTEIELMQGFVHSVAIALENTNLFKTVADSKERLGKANEQLKELDKLKDEFVSLASHELRTPMTAIRGSISTILDGYAGEISTEVRDFLTAAYNENDRLIRLVNNLLNISRIEAGRLVFDIKPIDMKKSIVEIVANLQMAAKEKGLTLVSQLPETLPHVTGDEDKVKEVIINLMGNAIKFTHQGGVTVGARVEATEVIISIADTGSGIEKVDQEMLFKKFSQVGGNYAKQSGGTGLGLYISKKIIEGLGGKIWLISQMGKGSTFSFSLPAV